MIDEKISMKKGMSAEEIQELRQKKKEELSEQQRAELLRSLSVRERLERKLQTDIVLLEMDDDLGKFSLKFRKLSPLEHDEIAQIQQKLRTNPEQTKELTGRLYEIIGGASLDGLTKEYWESGIGYSPDIFLSALLKVMASSAFPDQKYLDEIIKFRT